MKVSLEITLAANAYRFPSQEPWIFTVTHVQPPIYGSNNGLLYVAVRESIKHQTQLKDISIEILSLILRSQQYYNCIILSQTQWCTLKFMLSQKSKTTSCAKETFVNLKSYLISYNFEISRHSKKTPDPDLITIRGMCRSRSKYPTPKQELRWIMRFRVKGTYLQLCLKNLLFQ